MPDNGRTQFRILPTLAQSVTVSTRRFAAAVCQIRVDDQLVMVAERDLAWPLLDLVAAVLDQADAE